MDGASSVGDVAVKYWKTPAFVNKRRKERRWYVDNFHKYYPGELQQDNRDVINVRQRGNGLQHVQAKVNNYSIDILIDSGAALSCIDSKYLGNLEIEPMPGLILKAAGDNELPILGRVIAGASFGGVMVQIPFIAVFELGIQCILGLDFLRANNAVINCAEEHLTIVHNGITLSVPLSNNGDQVLPDIFKITVLKLNKVIKNK